MAGDPNGEATSNFNSSVATGGYFITATTDFNLDPTNVSNMSGNSGTAGNSGAFGPIRIPQYIAVGTSQEHVANFSIATDGAISAVSDLGTTRVIGYMSIAYFNNDSGLAPQGNSNFTSSAASGEPIFYQPGVGPAAQTQAGTLELSNVDLSTEFSNMIITQQGYDANAKTITTAQQMLQAIINAIQ
jgi:flagellar hook-basal body protein